MMKLLNFISSIIKLAGGIDNRRDKMMANYPLTEYRDEIIKLYRFMHETSIGLWPTAVKFYYKIRVKLK